MRIYAGAHVKWITQGLSGVDLNKNTHNIM